MTPVESILKGFYRNNSLFFPRNTNGIQFANKTTEVPIMLTSCFSYRERIFAGILRAQMTILLRSSIGKRPTE